MNFDLVVFSKAKELIGGNAAEIHRLPLFNSLSKHLKGMGKVVIVTHYVSLLVDIFRNPKLVMRRLCGRYERKISDNLFVYTPVILFNLKICRCIPILRGFTRSQIRRQLLKFFDCYKFFSIYPKVIWVSHPYHIDYLGLLPAETLSIYDCLDGFDIIGDSENKVKSQEYEKKLAKKVDIVFASGLSNTERMQKINFRTYNFPQAVDKDRFTKKLHSGVSVAKDIECIPGPRIGFCGCLKSYDDLDLFEQIIALCPKWSFVVVGEVAADIFDQFARLNKLQNMFFLGWKDARLLPSYLQYFDVGIILSKVNEVTNTFSPYKLYEYFGAGIPVVSTPIREVLQFRDIIEIATMPEEYISAIEKSLLKNSEMLRSKYMRIIESENWDCRAKFAIDLIQRALKDKI
jgi:hypothetical protein